MDAKITKPKNHFQQDQLQFKQSTIPPSILHQHRFPSYSHEVGTTSPPPSHSTPYPTSVQLPPPPSHSTLPLHPLPYVSTTSPPPSHSTPYPTSAQLPPTLPLHPLPYVGTTSPLPSHSTPYPTSVQLPPYPPTSHLTAGVDFFSFDLASAGLNEGIILGPRTLCLIPGGPASGGGSEPLPPSGRRMLRERNQ